MGHADRYDRRGASEGPGSGHAGHLHQGHPRRPTGHKEHLRMPRVQDQDSRSHIRLDFQPEEQGEGQQMGAGRRGPPSAG